MHPSLPSRFILRLAFAGLLSGGIAPMLRAADGGDSSCLVCHGNSRLTVARNGENVSLHVDAHEIGLSVHSSLSCTDCHDGLSGAKPHHGPVAQVDCRGCHENLAKTHAFHADFLAAKAAATPETDCAGCHGSHGVQAASGAKSSFAGPKLAAACGECHAEAAQSFLNSAHGAALVAGRGEAPNCLTCHLKPVAVGSDKLSSRTSRPSFA